MTRILLTCSAALVLAGCAAARPGVPVAVATSDGAQRYVGERSRDSLTLTAETGTACAADLQPTKEAKSGRPAVFGGVRCEDGRIGMLLLSGAATDAGGPVSGVMDRRPVTGSWGSDRGPASQPLSRAGT